jgi:hypothetical protein
MGFYDTFDQKDIEAVASSRVGRAEKRNMLMWVVGGIVTMLVSNWSTNRMFELGLLAVGAIGIGYYFGYVLDRKQKQAKANLVAEWKKAK